MKRRLATLAAAVVLCGFGSVLPVRAATRPAKITHLARTLSAQDVPIAGGYREVSKTDPDVLAAARFAAREEGRRRGNRLTLMSVERAEAQVVAGANYRLRLRVNAAGRPQDVDAVVYQNLRRRYSLTSWEAASGAAAREVSVYLVALENNGKTGRRIGCGDSLVPVRRTVNVSGGAVLKATLDELLSTPRDYDERLKNFWRGNNLRVSSVSLTGGVATVRITGEGPFIAGVCDAPRITEQISATARQFPGVRRVAVFVNGLALARALR